MFAKLCGAGQGYEKDFFPIPIRHFSRCRVKEIPQHAERAELCIHPGNREAFAAVLEKRRAELTPAQEARINKVMGRVSAL